MRNFRFLLLTALFPLIFMGCKSEEDSYPPIHYGYNLAFVDENGTSNKLRAKRMSSLSSIINSFPFFISAELVCDASKVGIKSMEEACVIERLSCTDELLN